MLRSLLIRDIVLIEVLDLEFGPGLNVLTGETGAGKSILLDALGFAIGRATRRDLVRVGADTGSATAVFEPGKEHIVWDLLRENDLPLGDGELILRRVAAAQGPSRAFVNDQRVSADVLSRVGAALVEVHGQHDGRGLLSARVHGALLDEAAGLGDQVSTVRRLWSGWQAAIKSLTEAEALQAKALADEEFLRHSVDELETLAPTEGEDEILDARRRLMKQASELMGEIEHAQKALSPEGAEGALGDALSRLMHIADRAEGRLESAVAALDRTMAELGEAQALLSAFSEEMRFDPGQLDEVEERLFAIRGLARKHGCAADDLPDLTTRMAQQLRQIDAGGSMLAELGAAVAGAEQSYMAAASALSSARAQAAERLDGAVTAELPPLRMENARFVTDIESRDPGPDGLDSVRFTASINPGAPAGPIDRIASGGELSRFLLALKVQLAGEAGAQTMVFDEIDQGVGGATADAVGRRLSRLSKAGQVLVVTHSPQVAARGDGHFQIAKSASNEVTRTHVRALTPLERKDEIARMLAGD
ncbi:MAG: DNA repair protein RecN, partial [Paracoccaceae bacterium]